MTYVVTPPNGHPETLQSGRLVAAGDEVSNAEARKNSRLIERGALTEHAEKRKSKSAPKPVEPAPEIPAPAPEKEENK